jgi:hypothetical protein
VGSNPTLSAIISDLQSPASVRGFVFIVPVKLKAIQRMSRHNNLHIRGGSTVPFDLSLLLRQATASGSKSTALAPIALFFGAMILSIGLLIRVGAPEWIVAVLCAVAVLLAILYIAAYIYFMIRSPEFLRSERFYLQKLAIEKGIRGDDTAGIIDVSFDAPIVKAGDTKRIDEANGDGQ